MKSKGNIFGNIALQLLSGLIMAFLSTLLIYFKQKPLLHHFVILFSAASIYFGFYLIKSKVKIIPAYLVTIALTLLIILCWLAPQFIYQIRPFTFYISGIALGSAVLIVLSSNIFHDQRLHFPWDFAVLTFAYLIGIFIQAEILQYSIIGLLLIFLLAHIISNKTGYRTTLLLAFTFLVAGQLFWQFSKPIIFHAEQEAYEDKVLFASETQFHKLVITQWQEDHWFYIDNLKNVSSIDEYLFYEPMVHAAFQIRDDIKKVLVIGGENGCLIREVLKYEDISNIHMVSYDTLLRQLGMENSFFTHMNENSFNSPKVEIVHEYLLDFVSNSSERYDAIFIDLPDPRSIETNQYYTVEFYRFVRKLLADEGVMVTQAGSPYFATEAFYAIRRTLHEAGFQTLPIHNQILTLGEWGWYICSADLEEEEIREKVIRMGASPVQTSWWNQEAAQLVTSFGKTYSDTLNVGINSLQNPLVYQYYLKGNWDMN